MNVKYRQFKTSDSKVVAQLIHNLYQEDPCDKQMSDKKIRDTFDAFFYHPDKGTIIVLENDNVVIGYAILISFWSNEFGGNIVGIDEIYIKEEFRSKGIGTSFIKYLMDSKFGNSVAIYLEVRPGNKRDRKLYEKLGFKLYKNSPLFLELE